MDTNETSQYPFTEFTIDRSRWARRGKNGPSAMLNERGSMCCLGFAAKACGIEDERLGVQTPYGVKDFRLNVAFPWLITDFDNSDEAYALMKSNDGVTYEHTNGDESEEALEAFITKTFADHGVTVHFVDGQVAA